ncbi:MAG TPA: radical SAM protein [bacterium]|nr:radical SAM protein [bacterium]
MTDLLPWLDHCELCPNLCRVNRRQGQTGQCRLTDGIVVSAADLHFGEEPMLVGKSGSGAIFFTACNLSCVFCQNYDISQLDRGKEISQSRLAAIMLDLQAQGALNINLVTPTHQAAQISAALSEARRHGLGLPIVYNCGGYENSSLLKELEGQVQIYMPDFKYGSDRAGFEYSGVKGYNSCCKQALQEMHRQVGDLELDSRGIALGGLLIRHLVLPNRSADSKRVIDFIAELSLNTAVNIMDQYRPAWHAGSYRALNRRTYRHEVEEVVEYARGKGLGRLIS